MSGPLAAAPLLLPSAGPESTVRSILSLARSLALLVALLAGLLFLILLVLGAVAALFGAVPTDLVGVVYCLLSALINYLLWREIPALEALAAQRQFAELRDHLLLWVVLGVVFFVVVGLVLAVAWVKVEPMAAASPPPVSTRPR